MLRSHFIDDAGFNAAQSSSNDSWRRLRYEDSYPCPFCRQGQICGLYLMEVFSCNLCDHIFSSNLPQQTLTLETGAGPRAKQWRWYGDRWQPERQSTGKLTMGLQALSIAIILLPTALISISGYMFPPLPTQASIGFPILWAALTGASHLALVLWFWLEYYQISVWVILRVRLQRWRWA
ncbi:hypothetical protein C1752_02829 [Acaryochloris thomasi RCC1774]|uniref:Uncharacterized protein n=1 Tax=Acaryochloris thomasi RCC1774 TaxID=1764569 RepID=A0A2W1JQB1_9CYAN|nr:hypothetical protein [Acaryochloris thomasi]PZD73082.1 hypothetical protein C1752_02829 [Acaryochloris thomasi RCC1774]